MSKVKYSLAPGKKGLRTFGLLTGAILAVLFGLLLPWLFDRTLPLWPWIVAGTLWLWALFLPVTLLPVYRGWIAVGNVLGWVNTRIILAIMFYLLFLPVGLFMRVMGKDPMARDIEKTLKTYRVERSRKNRNHVENPY